MLDYEKQRQLIVVFTLGVILVVIFVIIALVFIWLPENEEEKETFEVGKVNYTNVQESDIIVKYYNTLSNMLLYEKIDEIYPLVANDYLEYNELSKQSIEEYLHKKGVLGKNMELTTSKTYSIPGYNKVYYLDLKAANEMNSIGIIIKEFSPENYTIAFDKFVDFSKDIYSSTVNSIGLKVLERIRNIDSVEYKIRITNNYDKNVVINNKSVANAVLLISSDSKAKVPVMNTLATKKVELIPGESRNITTIYQISDEYDHILYNTLVLKGVSYGETYGETDIQYTLVD